MSVQSADSVWGWRRGVVTTAGIWSCSLAFAGCLSASAGEPLPRTVLVLSQFEQASASAVALRSNLREILRKDSAPVSVYVENLDRGRFGGPRFDSATQAYFRDKYRDKSIGVMVAVGSGALDLALQMRTGEWSETPVIFAGVDEGFLEGRALPARVTGTAIRAPLSDSISVAQAIVPGLKSVAIVGDPPERQFIRRNVAAQLESIAAQFRLIDLTRLTMAELKQQIARLPADSAILYIGLTADAKGVTYTSHEALAELAEVANRPIVVQADTLLGTGAVGGIVTSPASMGDAAARLALRVLAGEEPETIPVTTGTGMRPVFDWRQLQRWNVSADGLPSGSEIRFRDTTVWEHYRWQILTAIYLFLAQAALIVWLLYERHRRHVSESSAHELSGRLINAQEDERARLARELHDDVTQRLALLAINAGREERNPAAGTAMRTMRDGLVRLSEDVHALSYRLHPSILEDLGLIEALRSECERFSATCSTRLDVHTPPALEKLPRDIALGVFRIAQEGLRNIARHSQAHNAELVLQRRNGALELVVKDDGVGFDPAPRRRDGSLGHASMRQRAILLGGTLAIDSVPGRGTTIAASVPLGGGTM